LGATRERTGSQRILKLEEAIFRFLHSQYEAYDQFEDSIKNMESVLIENKEYSRMPDLSIKRKEKSRTTPSPSNYP